MDPLWSETCWSTFKYFIILIVSTYYIYIEHSWIMKCLIETYLKKTGWVWTEFIWKTKELLLIQQWYFGFHKAYTMSWPLEDTWRLCSMELIGSNVLERLWKEAVLPNLGHYSSICLEGLKKIVKTSIVTAGVPTGIWNGTKDIRSRQTQVREGNACANLLSRYVREQETS